MTFNKETETMYRGLSPHKITPMSGVLHTEPGLRAVFSACKISVPFRSGSVIVAVITLKYA